MAVAHVQTPAGGAANASATSVTLAFGSNVAAASAIVVGWRYVGSGRTVTLSDTQTNTYTSNAIEILDDDGSTTGIGFALNVTGGACTVTFAISGAAAGLRFTVSEFSGAATSLALDKTASAKGTSSAPASGAVTPTTNGQLFYAVSQSENNTTFTAGTDFTIGTAVPATAGVQRLGSEYYIQPTAASHDGAFAIAFGPMKWGCALVTLKDTSGGAAVTVKQLSALGVG